MFGFQRLDAYRAAIKFLAIASQVVARIGRGHGDLVDQFRRAALSVPLNIAEGTGKFSRDGVRYYTIARGSALECAAVLDAMAWPCSMKPRSVNRESSSSGSYRC